MDNMFEYNQEEMDRQWQELIEEENMRFADEQAHNLRIFKAIKKVLGEEYLEAVKDCLKDSEAQGKLELVRIKGNPKKHSHYQEEDWIEFDHVLVDQYVNGGYVGDDFAGDIYIPLRKNLYLKSYYSM